MNSRGVSTTVCLFAVIGILVFAGSAVGEVTSKASSSGLVQPPTPFNIFSSCPPAVCTANWDGLDSPASGSTDFTPAGIPLAFQFETGEPLTYSCNQQQETCMATYGEGGAFTMTGPLGTFSGIVTSGNANQRPLGFEIAVTFSGQWSTGLQMSGSADERYVEEFQIPDTGINMHPISGPPRPATH